MKRLEPGLMRRGWILILAMAAIHPTAVVTTGDIRTATAERGGASSRISSTTPPNS